MPGYQDHLCAAVNQKLEQAPALGVDFSIFIPIVLNILAEILGECGQKSSQATLSARLLNANSDPIVALSIREAVRRANKRNHTGLSGQQQSLIRQGLREGFSSLDDSERKEICHAACMQAYGVADDE